MNEFWSSLASLLGALAFLQTLFPPHLRLALASLLRRLLSFFSSHCHFDIPEIDGVNTNELYSAATLYLSSSSSSSSCRRLSLSRPLNSSSFTFSLSNHDRLHDTFRGSLFTWEHVVVPRTSSPPSFSFRPIPDDKRTFILRTKINVDVRHSRGILEGYLNHVMDRAAEIRRTNQDRLLYTNARGGAMDSRGQPWESVPFKHPSTFDTLAMDPEKKSAIMNDLKDFAEGKSFYEKTGRAWKRGYLLYGPPGTGKSSMIAAMANYLGYDIYDLELTEVHTNSELRKLLMKTTSKSIIVIEDIDCSINLTNRGDLISSSSSHNSNKKMIKNLPSPLTLSKESPTITLSGLLNFTDGLWSCCGSERIFVFTTNHVERLDPALLRSGRMDMHIFMSHCSFPALRILMNNYLGVEEIGGGLMRELEEVVEEAEMTPADVSEVLIKNKRFEKERTMRELLEVLKGRLEEKKKMNNNNNNNNNKKRRNEGEEQEEEEEEQEKRALESPKRQGLEEEGMESCKGEGEGKEGKD